MSGCPDWDRPPVISRGLGIADVLTPTIRITTEVFVKKETETLQRFSYFLTSVSHDGTGASILLDSKGENVRAAHWNLVAVAFLVCARIAQLGTLSTDG